MNILKINNREYDLIIIDEIDLKEEKVTFKEISNAIQTAEMQVSEVCEGEDFMIVDKDINKTIVGEKGDNEIVITSIFSSDNIFIL